MKLRQKLKVLFTLAGLLWGLGIFSAQAAETTQEKSLLDCFRGAATAPSSEAAIRAIKEVHADFTYFPAKGNNGYAQYFSKVGTPDPGLKTDFLKESIGLAHGAGVKVFVTYAVGCDTLAAQSRPDWAFRRSDGEIINIIGPVVCFNSPYREYAIAQIEELVTNYPIDGLLVDILWWGNMGTEWCCCNYCKQAYQVKFGKVMPEELNWEKLGAAAMKQAIEWRRDSLEETYREIHTKVKSIRPDLPLSYHGMVSWHIGRGSLAARTNCLRLSDIAYIEVYGDPSFYTAWLRGISRKPVMNVPLGYGGGESGQAAAAAIVAHGGKCMMGLTPFTKTIYREIEEKQPYLEDASPVLYAAIVYSEASKIYYRHENEPYVTLQPLKWLPEVIDYTKDNIEDRSPMPNIRGAFDLLQKLHVPVEFLSEMDLNLPELKKFIVVILPNTAILTGPQVEALSQYVKQGGSILATYETSLCDEFGMEQDNFDLSDVFGLKYLATRRRFDTIFHDGSSLESGKDLLTSSFRIPGPFVMSQQTAGTAMATQIIHTPGAVVGWGPRPTKRSTDIPAVHLNHYGKGKSIYVSAPLFKIHTLPVYSYAPAEVIKRFHGNPFGVPFSRRESITNLTQELLDELAPNPPIRVEGELRLESTFFEQKGKDRVIVHLFTSTVDKITGQAYPLAPASVLIKKEFMKPRKVYTAWPARMELETKDKGKYLEVNVPETRIHQIVVFER